ncbi:hypothetical protein ACEPAG_2630 [Sanghuangporus baumii]
MMPSMSFKNTPYVHATYQPLPQDAMDTHSPKEHAGQQCGHETQCGSHKACHAARRRRLLLSAFIIASILLLLGILGLMYTYGCSGMVEMLGDGVGLIKRQTNGNPNNDEDGVFVRNKLYLIVVFVGLFVCLVLAIMLAAWCCRGAFENPLCCPCYLCACCGGLACLECISCGLCAEGVDQIGYN